MEEIIEWQDWFDRLGDPLFIVDEDHRILKANRAASEFLSRPKDKIEGSHCYRLVHDDSDPPETCPLGPCINGEGETEEEFYEPHLDKYIRARIFPASSPEKESDKTYCTHQLQDVTEEKRRMEELASYPERNPHPVVEWDSDMELRFANEAGKRLLTDGSIKALEYDAGCLEEELPDIREDLRGEAKIDRKSPEDVETRQIYREFICNKNGEKFIYGFYFHFLPDREAVRAYGFDVTERHQAEEELRQANSDLELLIKVSHLLTRVSDRTEFLDRACRAITDVQDYPLVWVGRKGNGPNKRVIPEAHAGFEEGYLDELDVRWSDGELGQGPTGRAIRKNEPQVKEKIPVSDDDDYRPWRDKAQRHKFTASIALPIPREGEDKVYGALNIYLQERATFSESRVRLLQELANDLGHGLQYIETQKELRETTIGTLEALSRTVEAKDKYTGEHVDRVEEYALELGERLGLSQGDLEQLGYAAELHDVGKVRIPDSILGKSDSLTEEEWEEMKKHPEIGAEILRKVPRLERAAKIVAQHQEKYDGTGYPKGLEGQEITLEARIIAVVDAWDAMQTDRPYRDAIPRNQALKELKENSGSQFDPRVVREFMNLLEDDSEGKYS